MAIMNHDDVAKLIEIAKEDTIYDKGGEYAQVDDYAGGNVDDAYVLGTSDGRIELAREILSNLGILW